MYEVKKIDIKSSAKMYAALVGVVYAAVAIIFLVVNIAVSLIRDEITFVGLASALLSLVLVTILSVVFGALSGVVLGWVYNFIAKKIGGVRIGLEKVGMEVKKEDEAEE